MGAVFFILYRFSYIYYIPSYTLISYIHTYVPAERTCKATAQTANIEGAITKALRENKHICSAANIYLSHGGNWDGYLVVGNDISDLSRTYCGSRVTFTTCSPGGNNDLPRGVSKDIHT